MSIPKTSIKMLLDDHLFIMRKKSWSIQHIDWLFSLFGFLFLMISISSILFFPRETIDISIFGNYFNSHFYEVFFFVALVFFGLGSLYALINRILKIPTDWKLTIVHFTVTLFSLIFLMIKIFSDTSIIQLSSIYIVNSFLVLVSVFLLAQILFLINTTIGLIRRYAYN